MTVASCLRWGSRMATFTTTNKHDYRWPHSSCLVPKAEAPAPCYNNGAGESVSKTWCSGGPPLPPPPSQYAHARVCYDLVETSASSGSRPWCRRGPVDQLVNPNNAAPPTALQINCPPRNVTPRQSLKGNGTGRNNLPQECGDIRRNGRGSNGDHLDQPWCNKDASPHIVSAKMGAAPVQDTSRYDQPNQYLQKLCEKYPEPTGVVTATPRDELMHRIYADRYRTTYQSDFCKNADDSAKLIGECDTWDPDVRKSQPPPPAAAAQYQPVIQQCGCGCGCRVTQASAAESGEPRIRPLACRPAAVSHNVHFSCCSSKKKIKENEQAGPPEKLQAWSSEYTDSIGRTGKLILEQKLLSPKKKKKLALC